MTGGEPVLLIVPYPFVRVHRFRLSSCLFWLSFLVVFFLSFCRQFARHYESGEALPGDLFEKLCAQKTYMAGTGMLRQLYFGQVFICSVCLFRFWRQEHLQVVAVIVVVVVAAAAATAVFLWLLLLMMSLSIPHPCRGRRLHMWVQLFLMEGLLKFGATQQYGSKHFCCKIHSRQPHFVVMLAMACFLDIHALLSE